MANLDPQNARPEGGSYLELWCCLLVFIEENRDNSEHQAKLRQKEIQEIDKKASKEHEEAKKNSNFTQTYPKGWQRIRELVRDKTGCCRYRSLLIFR